MALGLIYRPCVVSVEFEQELLEWLETPEINQLKFSVGTGQNSRQVIHFGYSYDYTGKSITNPAPPIPTILKRLLSLVDCDTSDFNQVILNRYMPGQGINAHTDNISYGDVIVVFSIGSGIEMEFTRNGFDPFKIYIEQRSIYIMSGESRYLWKHQIRPRKNDTVAGQKVPRGTRWSITYRKV